MTKTIDWIWIETYLLYLNRTIFFKIDSNGIAHIAFSQEEPLGGLIKCFEYYSVRYQKESIEYRFTKYELDFKYVTEPSNNSWITAYNCFHMNMVNALRAQNNIELCTRLLIEFNFCCDNSNSNVFIVICYLK